MDTRQKLLQARQLEKTYQEKHRLGQKEPQVDFIKGLKNLGIDSMTDYHKLVKTDGYKGRNIEVRQVVSTPLQMAKDAVADNKDIVMWEISKNIRVYTGSLDVAEKTLNVDFCKKEGIELIPIGIKNNGWMSIAGNPSIQFALKRPIDTSSFKNKTDRYFFI